MKHPIALPLRPVVATVACATTGVMTLGVEKAVTPSQTLIIKYLTRNKTRHKPSQKASQGKKKAEG